MIPTKNDFDNPIIRATKVEIGDRLHLAEDDDNTLFHANSILILEHHPNEYWNYVVVGFRNLYTSVSMKLKD